MGSKLITNIPQLQNLIKRDPESYREEFESQFVYYVDAKEIFKLSPSIKDSKFYDLVMFLAQVAQCYPDDEELREFPNDIVGLLRTHGPVLHPETRLGLVKALILMRNKDLLPPLLLVDLCFDLLRCQDKMLRKLLQLHIITDIKNINAKSKNMVLNRELQDFLSRKLVDNHAVAVKTALDVLIDLYKKGVWKDKRNVNIIATACYSKSAKIMVTAIKFFVGNDEGEQEDSDSESEKDAPNVKKALMAMKANRKTKKRENKIEKIKKAANANKKDKKKKSTYDFSALHLLHDPQTVAEKIFKIFNKRNERFEVKLLMMNMVSRLIGIHQLYVSNFYPTLQKFLFPHQREVTKVMTYAAQAAHPLMSPDDLYPVLRCLADNFVTERYSTEVMAMGINAIRELCNRNFHAMDEDLLQDLVEYRNHKDKGVYMAARSLMALYRLKNPALLARKTRGMPTELMREESVKQFGENTAKDYIPGAEVLAFISKPEAYVEEEDSSCESEDESEDEQMEEEAVPEEKENMDINETATTIEEEDSESEEYDSDCDGDGEEEEGSDDEKNEPDTDEKTNSVTKKAKKVTFNETGITEDMNSEEIPEEKVVKKKGAIEEAMKRTAQERADIASKIVSSGFITDEQFSLIDAMTAAKQVERYKNKETDRKNKKRKRGADDDEDHNPEVVPLSSIEMIYKKRRHDKTSRLQAVLQGREGRDKFGSTKGRSNPNASKTNKEKSKSKAFDMIKHKKRYTKQKATYMDKAAKLKISMLRKLKFN